MLQELTFFRGIIDAALMSSLVGRNKTAADLPYKALEAYAELALPYIGKKNKIDKNIGISDIDQWAKILAERKKELAERKKKEAK